MISGSINKHTPFPSLQVCVPCYTFALPRMLADLVGVLSIAAICSVPSSKGAPFINNAKSFTLLLIGSPFTMLCGCCPTASHKIVRKLNVLHSSTAAQPSNHGESRLLPPLTLLVNDAPAGQELPDLVFFKTLFGTINEECSNARSTDPPSPRPFAVMGSTSLSCIKMSPGGPKMK